MTDLIPRDAKHEEALMDAVWSALKADTSDLGKQQRILIAFRAIPAIDPAAIREAALKEAAGLIADMSRIITHTDEDLGTLTGRNLIDPRKAAAAILALIGEKK